MTTSRLSSTVACFLLAAAGALAAARPAGASALAQPPGSLVAVSVTIDEQPAQLYSAPDGSSRLYLEARPGSRYAVRLQNRSSERLGAVLTVDGLNVISGARDTGRGRMYVLDPWQATTVQGWRTSLDEVQRFRFVDERASYAARSGRANGKMGWIELAVYRECRPQLRRERADAAAGRSPAPAPALPEAKAEAFPGTGWGERAHDEVVLVSFEPESAPSERVTLRYEYRPALVALGVIPQAQRPDRLQQRERAEAGFAAPPPW